MTDRDLFEKVLEAMEHLHRTGDTQVFDMCYAPELIPALQERLSQPEREWVGLTKEEAKEISLANRPYVVDMIAALEARLKEKNT